MNTERLTITIPKDLIRFVSQYQKAHSIKSKSSIFSDALKLLQAQALKKQYIEANTEIDQDLEFFNEDGISHNPSIMRLSYI